VTPPLPRKTNSWRTATATPSLNRNNWKTCRCSTVRQTLDCHILGAVALQHSYKLAQQLEQHATDRTCIDCSCCAPKLARHVDTAALNQSLVQHRSPTRHSNAFLRRQRQRLTTGTHQYHAKHASVIWKFSVHRCTHTRKMVITS
jgi:hypothetical protein